MLTLIDTIAVTSTSTFTGTFMLPIRLDCWGVVVGVVCVVDCAVLVVGVAVVVDVGVAVTVGVGWAKLTVVGL